MTNPLLEAHTLPPFNRIKAEDVVPAITTLIDEAKQGLEKQLSENDALTWENLIEPIESREDKMGQAWSPVSHLNGVMNSDALRDAYEEAEGLLTDYYTEVGQNRDLYEAYEGLLSSSQFESLSQPQKKTISNAVRNFKLSGVALEGEAKASFKQVKSELSRLTTTFSNNVLDATNGWSYHLEVAEGDDQSDALAGLPDFIIDGAKKAAKDKDLSGYVFTLDLPVYFTIMSQSENEPLRKVMYEAYCTRASQEGPTAGQWDNTEIITEILALRQKLAALLNYNNYAEVSLAKKMASSPEEVVIFLSELAEKTRPFADKEIEELKAFAKNEFSVNEISAWDIPYFSEQLKLKKYNVSQELLRPYFPLTTVKAGMFKLVEKLYGIDVREAKAEVWHEDASFYEIFKDGNKIASFYFDLFARAKKRGGAWMADCRDRRINNGEQQLPVAFLVCNFNAPVDGKPSLLTHNEVTTLFHEFGHGLHHMLTKINVAAVSGISGVEWDAVELPSQFMENFCWQPEVLSFISEHFESGDALPKEMLGNMLAAKNFQSAMQMLRQIEFALFDLRLHMEFGDSDFPGVQALLDEVREKVAVLIPPSINKFQNGFSHIFAGGYAAGYYSYKWAEVLSADAFSAFEEEGVFNAETGQRFLTEILEKGGSQSALELFTSFRGRAPSPEPLMRHSGLAV